MNRTGWRREVVGVRCFASNKPTIWILEIVMAWVTLSTSLWIIVMGGSVLEVLKKNHFHFAM